MTPAEAIRYALSPDAAHCDECPALAMRVHLDGGHACDAHAQCGGACDPACDGPCVAWSDLPHAATLRELVSGAGELSRAHDEIERLRANCATLAADNRRLDAINAGLGEQNRQLHRGMARRGTTITRLTRERAEARAEVGDLIVRVESIAHERDARDAAIDRLTADLSTATGETARLRAALAEAQLSNVNNQTRYVAGVLADAVQMRQELRDIAEVVGTPYMGSAGLAGAVRLAHDALRAEGARIADAVHEYLAALDALDATAPASDDDAWTSRVGESLRAVNDARARCADALAALRAIGGAS